MNSVQALVSALGIIAIGGIFSIAIFRGTSLFAAFCFAALVVMIVAHVVGGGRAQ